MSTHAIERVAVLGTGMMGPGIAYCFASAGLRVTQFGRGEESLLRGRRSFDTIVGVMLQGGLLSEEEASQASNNLRGVTDMAAAVSGADLVVESVVEDLPTKQALFAELEGMVSETTIITSNTSGLPITRISGDMKRPERTATTHFWNPPHLVPLVEIVKGSRTTDETAEALRELLTGIGKRPVVVRKDVPGQLGARILHAITRECLAIVRDGVATAEEVDTAIKTGLGLRFPVYGPLEHADLVGLDLTQAVASYLWQDLADDKEPTSILREKNAAGDVGAKTGKGLYDWTKRDADEVKRNRDAFLMARLKDLYPPRPAK